MCSPVRIAPFSTLCCAILVLAGCGGGGGSESPPRSNIPPPPPAPPPVITGVFKDLNVSGISFESGQETGITSATGRFTCESANDVSFSIGAVSLGQTACAALVTPTQLFADDADLELQVTNLARMLQMLDLNGDPNDGILISSAVQQVAPSWAQVDFRAQDLANDLTTIISDAASVDGELHTLPSAQDAISHLNSTLSCAYAGVYSGSFTGTNSGAAAMVIGWTAPLFGFVPYAFQWQGFDSINEFEVFGGGGGSITFRNLPRIDHTGPNLAGPIAADFVTPDRIVGTWEGGNVDLYRIGADNGGEYRFIGTAEGPETAAYISVNLADTTFAGGAFEVFEGTAFDVSGSLSGDAVSLTATGGGETLTGTGTLTRNPDDSPREVQGTLDNGSSFSIVACRLN